MGGAGRGGGVNAGSSDAVLPDSMKRFAGSVTTWRVLLLLVWAAAVPAGARAEQALAHKWWQSEQYQRALGLTAEQSARIEQIFQATLPKLREYKEALDRLEAELAQAIRQENADEGEVARLIDRVETARSELGKARALMLFRIHRVLTPDQREQLRRLHQRHDRDRRRPDRPRL
jgi:Spy/CpxP family protein refolding chaperone